MGQFLQFLKGYGFSPNFFGCDKDQAEIGAIQHTWPPTETVVQLCHWHAKRAVMAKLNDNHVTCTQSHYHPGIAQTIVAELEICWGSEPMRRPTNDHKFERCSCPSRSERFPEKGRMEPTVGERKVVLNMFAKHFNMHPLIPDGNGTYRSAHEIHKDCAVEMYRWCRSRNYFRLWAYVWVNWYSTEKWQLSVLPTKIPVPMIVEAHWRKIKHDYLHRFNRPRIDLVVWILTPIFAMTPRQGSRRFIV